MSKGNGHKTETPDVSHIRNVEVTHETSDINVNGVLTFVLVLFIATVGVYFGMAILFNLFESQEKKIDTPRGTMALSKSDRLPPEPRLQSAPGFGVQRGDGQRVNLEKTKPAAEYETVSHEWAETLEGKSATAAMPIEQAMKQVVTQGLPVRDTGGSAKITDFGVHIPTAASSGRTTEKLR